METVSVHSSKIMRTTTHLTRKMFEIRLISKLADDILLPVGNEKSKRSADETDPSN